MLLHVPGYQARIRIVTAARIGGDDIGDRLTGEEIFFDPPGPHVLVGAIACSQQ
jgi:hypothetical protein